jgi:hypothetical protein
MPRTTQQISEVFPRGNVGSTQQASPTPSHSPSVSTPQYMSTMTRKPVGLSPVTNISSAEASKSPTGSMPAASQMGRNPEFEVSMYDNGEMSWKRSSANDDCLKLYSDRNPDGEVLRTDGGPVPILITPPIYAEVILKPTKGANTTSLVILKLKEGDSVLKLMFDRSPGSSLKHGRSQGRDFIKWLFGQCGGKLKSSVDRG